jgi:signal transduction histidine kinase
MFLSPLLRITLVFAPLFGSVFVFSQELAPSASTQKILERSVAFMNKNQYDSAHYLVSEVFSQTEQSLSDVDMFFLHSIESEILYYNALFEQGLQSANTALNYSKRIDESNFLGSAENLVGLQLMNLKRYAEAANYLRRAISHLEPMHPYTELAFQYHAYTNLGECFVYLNQPDSALHVSLKAIPEARNRQRPRGEANAYWNMSQAYVLKSDLYRADSTALAGLQLISTTEHIDVATALTAVLMNIQFKKNNISQADEWLSKGLELLSHPLNTDYARTTFLEKALAFCSEAQKLDKGIQLLNQLKTLQQEINNKQQTQRTDILTNIYEKNKALTLANETSRAQNKEIQLRKIIGWVLVALAALLLVLILTLFISFRRKQSISALEYQNKLRSAESEMEIRSLRETFEAIAEERNRIASDLHDDIGASLSSIRIYSSAAQKQLSSNPSESLSLIEKINESSTNILEQMSDIVWCINPKNDNSESLIMRMKAYTGECLGAMQINCNYTIDHSVQSWVPTMHIRKNIYLLFKEAINNCMKYSGANQLDIAFSLQYNSLKMSIADNGMGFDMAEVKHGNGLNNMKNRAQSAGGSLAIFSAKGQGTRIVFNFPLATFRDATQAPLP